MAEAILPGTYITVRDEGLISAGSIAAGNIGIVGTAAKGAIDTVTIVGSFAEAQEIFGERDSWQDGTKNELTLIRALDLIYNNGGKTVYVVRTAAQAGLAKAALVLKDGETELIKLEARGTPGSWGNFINVKMREIDASAEGNTTTKKKLLDLSLDNVQESYTLTEGDLAAFAQQVTTNSRLVTAQVVASRPGNRLPANTLQDTFLQGGADGANAGKAEYQRSLALLENEIVNIVVLAGQDSAVPWTQEVLEGHLRATAEMKRERIGIMGSAFVNGQDDLDQISRHSLMSDRLIYAAPGILVSSRDPKTGKDQIDRLPGGYLAAALSGLIASLPVQASPTNKTLTLTGLSTVFNASQLEKLVLNRVLAVEKRDGYRVVKGITTHDGAWRQITTRRIVDYAIYGVRSGCNPYIGKLNNERVRGAMKATLDAFLTRMVNDEALVGYTLAVSATRAQEVAGEAIVTLMLQPTFSIDFIKVTMYLS